MKKLTDIFQQKDRTYSFELFPTKTEQGTQNLLKTIEQLAALKPDFISCTYGAGGGSREKTFDIVQHIQTQHHIPSVAHLTCVCHTKEEIRTILTDIKARGISNVLALRGDAPKDQPDWQPGSDNFHYSFELCHFIRAHFDQHFSVGVAGFPEGHVLCPDREQDAKYLRMKIDNGGDYVITQLFFNNQDYFDYVARLRRLGVTARVLPGIMLITNYPSLVKFCATCGCTVSDRVRKIFEPIQDNPEKTLAAGIDFTIQQCRELLDGGAPGLHFYVLNKSHPVDAILKEVRR